ncbi:NAD(P)/FAD-dependent oxidoreductase [Micromonospora sp. NPDC048830]|uniref:NAD(P)/FAD-dependent oxidoreductase n=1 Tax=Micromonospora sp. NPDC048830 TaxID=3364257 RepID=UPI003721B337
MNTSGFFREACGPGWALVGDAGHRTDPIAASGITQAFHQAEMLARAAHHGLTHPSAMDDALRSFWKTRDARSDALHRATEVLASLAYSPETLELIQRPFTDDGQGSLAGILETLGGAGYRS